MRSTVSCSSGHKVNLDGHRLQIHGTQVKHPEDEKEAISQDEEEAREEDGLRKSATRKQQQAGMVKTSFIGLAISQ